MILLPVFSSKMNEPLSWVEMTVWMVRSWALQMMIWVTNDFLWLSIFHCCEGLVSNQPGGFIISCQTEWTCPASRCLLSACFPIARELLTFLNIATSLLIFLDLGAAVLIRTMAVIPQLWIL